MAWALSENGRVVYWQRPNVQNQIASLMNSVPFTELLLTQRLGAQLNSQLKHQIIHWPSQHLAQVIDDLLDGLRGLSVNYWRIAEHKPVDIRHALAYAQRLFIPLHPPLNRAVHQISWGLLALILPLVLLTSNSFVLVAIAASAAWVAMVFYATWKMHRPHTFDELTWTTCCEQLANDLSQQVYHLQPLFKAWYSGKKNQLSYALTNALDYQGGSADFNASLQPKLLAQLIAVSQQANFGDEQRAHVRNNLLEHLRHLPRCERQALVNQMIKGYWRYLMSLSILWAALLLAICFAYVLLK
jgi:hypothetical protein